MTVSKNSVKYQYSVPRRGKKFQIFFKTKTYETIEGLYINGHGCNLHKIKLFYRLPATKPKCLDVHSFLHLG